MKSKSIPIKKHLLQFSFLLGISIITYLIIRYITGNYTTKNIFHKITLLILALSSITIGLFSYKKNNNGFISLLEALKIGIGVTVLGGLMVTIWEIILLKVIDPDIITQLEEIQIKKIAENSSDFTQENIERKLAVTQKFTSPWIMILAAFIEDIIVGFFLSLIVGLLVRKKRDPFK
ncbi:hypothetical protein GCM10009430_39880 [Aquimarina litoralis]|uniref:DUF4199 domain-containing protein n=1 Tax=Aquimarina litoralis TaxID=584605 RepID=A0ABN1J6N0_9FLAO